MQHFLLLKKVQGQHQKPKLSGCKNSEHFRKYMKTFSN